MGVSDPFVTRPPFGVDGRCVRAIIRAAVPRLALALAVIASLWIVTAAQSPTQAPRIWDDGQLADWATPIAALNLRPAHYSSAQYYSVPADNFRTYPVYHPDSEPPGYWEGLQKQKPQPLVDVTTIRTREDWIAAGAPSASLTTSGVARPIRPSSRGLAIRSRSKAC